MSSHTMRDVVAEFNKLSGQNVKRFATISIGERRIAAFKAGMARAATTGHKQRITVDRIPYRSVAVAFVALKLPMSKHIKFRAKLKVSGQETFEHEGKKYNFVNIKQESLA